MHTYTSPCHSGSMIKLKQPNLSPPPKTFLIEPLLESKVNETCKLERKGKGEKWYNLISATSTRKGITEN